MCSSPALYASSKRSNLPVVATILLCGVDLFFRGKLEALLPEHRLIPAGVFEGIGDLLKKFGQ